MSTALRKLENATFVECLVAAGEVTYAGRLVVVDSGVGDNYVKDAGAATDLGIGIARETLTSSTGVQRCQVTLLAPVEAVTVGTGGATVGKKAVATTDGFTDAATHDSDNTGNSSIYGIFMQTGTAGQTVGLMLGAGNRGNA